MVDKACVRKETRRIVGETIGEIWGDVCPVLITLGFIAMAAIALGVCMVGLILYPIPTVIALLVLLVGGFSVGVYLDARSKAVRICEARARHAERMKNEVLK